MHVIQNDSQLLVVKSQIDTLILNLPFDYNLCCKYSNGSFKPTLDIYVSTTFQWYEELFNPMSFDLSNHCLEILKVHRKSNSQSGSPLGSIWTHSFTLPALPRMWMWLPCYTLGPHLFMTFTLVMSPKLEAWQLG
jgi:hypothetical protein